MRNFTLHFAPLLLLLAGCSIFKSAPPPPPPPRPLHLDSTATLDITNGIRVVASSELPRGFIPNPAVPPMWLAQDMGIAVAGSLDGKAIVIGLGGPKMSNLTAIASDFGPGAPTGRILEVAASPDGMELATADADPTANRLNLMLIDSISGGAGHSVASFDGDYRVASMNWIDRDTIAIVIRPSAPTAPIASNVDTIGSASGLNVIGISGLGSVTRLDKIHCQLASLRFSPNRRFAVSAGDSDTSPAIVNLQDQSCAELRVAAPIKILGWAPDSSAFIYAAREPKSSNVAVFRFSLATAMTTLIAVSSAAAAYASDGTIVAMGNGGLSWKRIARDPDAPAKAEIALLNPLTAVVTINSLGFQTRPAMFAQSSMVFTTASDSAAIDTFVPQRDGLLRELIDYSYPARSAFVLASGAARGPLSMSWSPDGRALAIVDGDASLAMLTVMIPPR
jgi:hypothetical protein